MARGKSVRKSSRSLAPLGGVLLFWGASLVFIAPPISSGQSRGEPIPRGDAGRNPFFLPPGIRPLSADGGNPARKEVPPAPVPKEPPKIQDLPEPSDRPWPFALKAILIGDRIRLAAIDQGIVSEGDPLRDERVLEIHPDRVVLGKGEKRRTIFLSQSPVRVKVEEPKAGEAP